MTLSSSLLTLFWMQALGVSTVANYLSSFALITDVIKTEYNLSVGIALLLCFFFLCLRPSVEFLTLIVQYRFYFKNMIDSKMFIFFGDKSLGKTGLKVSHMWISYIFARDICWCFCWWYCPPFCEIFLNYEVVGFQPRTLTTPDLG